MGGGPVSTPTERLQHWLEHLEHVLPAQAPIRDFVHHNTLHGFQHLPFPEALAAAQRLTGAAAYLPEATFQEFFAAGRIAQADLAAALEEFGVQGLDQPVAAGFTRRQVLLASLQEPVEPPAPPRLAWEIREKGVIDPGLWAACLARSEPALPAEPTADSWPAEALAWWEELTGRIGRDWTWRSLLEHLTGEDVLETVHTVLLRHLAAHLDLGVAAWRNPDRQKGFYAAWRASAGRDFAWDLDELPQVREEAAGLSDDPMETLVQGLSWLLPDEKLWFGYVERLCLELPGWSGMFLWRDRHPDWGDGTPVRMVDYLAVRVFLERLLIEDLVRRLTGAPMDLAELDAYFRSHPAELYVRCAIRRLPLSDELLHRTTALKRAGGDGRVQEAAWGDLARAMAGDGQAAAACREGESWLLYRRTRRLGLPAAELGRLGDAEMAALNRCAGELDAWARSQVWLLAYEGRYREQIFAALAANHGRCPANPEPSAQVVFCMDDREEGTRRHLEEIAPAVETFGAAGFFGVPMFWQGLDDDAPSALCPVVVRPAHAVHEVLAPEAPPLAGLHAHRRNWRLAWRERFYQSTRRGVLAGPLLAGLGAPAALLNLAGTALAPGWFGRALGRWREQFEKRVPTRATVTAADDSPATPEKPRAGFTDAEQADRVAAFLRSIGLTEGFAPLVALLGHGSGSRNNPHLAAYDCGACSGRHGGPNARVFAAMANRPAVRSLLLEAGIAIPAATWFLAGEHNTCDDGIEWYDTDQVPAPLQPAFDRLVAQLSEAARAHAAERCRRFASAPESLSPWMAIRHVAERRHDISEARPELGHATNAAAFIGRRSMSRGLFLDRRVFLISYDPSHDPDGAIVEGILLAAGPVGAGISLEYYFSTVDNERFGCSSKVTHNIVGLFGVMEGAESDLRTGLPRQMIEIHEAMRLLVVVEQKPEVLSAIVGRQPLLQELIGNGWIVVASQDPDSGALHHFCPRRGWLLWAGTAVLPRVARSADWFAGEREALPPALIMGAA